MVESALTLVLFVFTLIGIVDVGQVFMLHQALVERVRAGARYAVVNQYDDAAIKNVVLYNTASPAEGAKPLFLLTGELISTTLLEEGTAAERIEVRITDYPFRFFTPWIAGAATARPIVTTMPVESEGSLE
jgi:hypothetical protein